MICLPEKLPSTENLDDFGRREGPVTIEYRDFTWNHHPTYISYSCLGCKHLTISEHGDNHCNHPAYLDAYGCRQYIGGNYQHRDKLIVDNRFCPVLRPQGERAWPKQPAPMPIDRYPEYRVRENERNKPFEVVPVKRETAYLLKP